MECFDTGGQHFYESIVIDHVKQSQIVVLVFDVTDKDSFISLETVCFTYK